MTLNKLTIEVYEDSENGFFVFRDFKGNVRVYVDPSNLYVENGLGQRTPFVQSQIGRTIGMTIMETKFRFLDGGK